jgi:AcrR family transcriptional regulator
MSTQNRETPAAEQEPLGLRARKKQQTRTAISDVATRMFIERGFENVTVAEVAEAAGVSVNTVFNYFATKEELFFDRVPEGIEAATRAVRERRRGESAVAALRRSFRKAVKEAPSLPEGVLPEGIARFHAAIEASPALRARARMLLEEARQHLAATLAEEAGAPPDDPTAQAVAAMIMGLWGMIRQELHRRILAGDPEPVVRAAISKLAERSFELLLSGAGDYCVRASD